MSREGKASFNVPGLAAPCETFYEVFGDIPDVFKTPFIVLHGGPGGSHEYILSLAGLSDACIVVSYDQIGCEKLSLVKEKAEEKDGPLFLYGHSWSGMLGLEWIAATSYNVRKLVIASTPASISLLQPVLDTLRSRLPTETQEILDRCEKDGDFESPEYDTAVMVFYERHLSISKPFPHPEVRVEFECLIRCIHSYMMMWGPSELSVIGSLRDWSGLHLLENTKVPTLLVNGSEDEMQDAVMKPFFDRLTNVKWVTVDNAAHFTFVDQREKYLQHLRNLITAEQVKRSQYDQVMAAARFSIPSLL